MPWRRTTFTYGHVTPSWWLRYRTEWTSPSSSPFSCPSLCSRTYRPRRTFSTSSQKFFRIQYLWLASEWRVINLILKHALWRIWHMEAEAKWSPFCSRQFPMNVRVWTLVYLDWNFTEKLPSIFYMSALVQMMAWCWTSDKPLSEPMRAWFTDVYVRHWASMSPYVWYNCPGIN